MRDLADRKAEIVIEHSEPAKGEETSAQGARHMIEKLGQRKIIHDTSDFKQFE